MRSLRTILAGFWKNRTVKPVAAITNVFMTYEISYVVHATIFRYPAFVMENAKTRNKYFTSKQIYVPGVVTNEKHVVRGFADVAAARGHVADMVKFKSQWSEIVSSDRRLNDIELRRNDVVEYRARIT